MTVLRWHCHPNPILRNSGDTIDSHQSRVAIMCADLARHLGLSLAGSDLIRAAMHHDEAERVLGDMPGPAKGRFQALAAAYAEAEAVVMAEMGLSWTLTNFEAAILDLCDKLDAWLWAHNLGVTGPEWDSALWKLRVMARDIAAETWLDARTG